MKINLVAIEDGLNNYGFRKIAAYVRQIYRDTKIFYVTTGNSRTFRHLLFAKSGRGLDNSDIAAMATDLAQADVVGFSSMTQYAPLTIKLISAIRAVNPKIMIVWGGIHPIIEPEDAIRYADAICTGEGEFAFALFLEALERGQSIDNIPSFWVNTPGGIQKNMNLPLMTAAEMDALPLPIYQDGEYIYKHGKGFSLISAYDFIDFNGLSYKTIWSIGCPFKCTYCGNSKFIDYDRNYRKIRHSSPAVIIAELREAVRKHPHISAIQFDDDSFMALPMRVMEELSDLYKRDIGLPLNITGLIPNYVREDKMRLLVATGMNRVRMGIQSGSQSILEFYERPTPVARIREACRVLNRYRTHMIPPALDIILDNPVETIEDNRATLDLIHEMPRPFTLNVFSLRVIPNTRLAEVMAHKGVEIDDIRSNYSLPQPTISNIVIFAMMVAPLPSWLYRRLREHSLPSHLPQRLFPRLLLVVRFLSLCRRAADHLLRLDITILSGAPINLLTRLGLVRLWQRLMLPRAAARAARVYESVKAEEAVP